MQKLVAPNRNLIIYIDLESLKTDIKHYLAWAGVVANTVGGNRQYVNALKQLASYVNYIDEKIFDYLPCRRNNTFYNSVVLKTSPVLISNSSPVCLVLSKDTVSDIEAKVELRTVPKNKNSLPDVINVDGTYNDVIKLVAKKKLKIQNAIPGCIYLDKLGEKKYLYLGKCVWKGVIAEGTSYIAYGLDGREKEVKAVSDIPTILYDSMMFPVKDKTKRENHVFVELDNVNIVRYKKGQTLDDFRETYSNLRFKTMLGYYKKLNIKNQQITNYTKYNLIPYCNRTFLDGELEDFSTEKQFLNSESIQQFKAQVNNKDILFLTRWDD